MIDEMLEREFRKIFLLFKKKSMYKN